MTIRTCPTCGSKRIRRQVIDLKMTVKTVTRVVRDLELEVCPACGEKLFDIEASRKVEAAFATFVRRRARSKSKRAPRRKSVTAN